MPELAATRIVAAQLPDEPTTPEWKRTAFACDDGVVLLPATYAFYSEADAIQAAWHDAAPMHVVAKHPYVCADWMAELHPEHADALALVVDAITDAVRRERENEGMERST